MEDTSVMDQGEQTTGDFATEAEAAAAFDALIDPADWKPRKEVCGEILHPRLGVRQQVVRIDRMLFPTESLIKQGWKHGAIGIELKRSGESIGPVIAQAQDYLRSAWRIQGGVWVLCSYVFIWHLTHVKKSAASVMAQSSIGCASGQYRGSDGAPKLRLMFNNQVMYLSGNVKASVVGGLKAGSR